MIEEKLKDLQYDEMLDKDISNYSVKANLVENADTVRANIEYYFGKTESKTVDGYIQQLCQYHGQYGVHSCDSGSNTRNSGAV